MKGTKTIAWAAAVLALAGALGLSYAVWSECSASHPSGTASAPPTDAQQTISVTLDPAKPNASSAKSSAGSPAEKPQKSPRPAQPRAGSSATTKRYYSYDHRPIDVRVFGAGTKTVLIMGWRPRK